MNEQLEIADIVAKLITGVQIHKERARVGLRGNSKWMYCRAIGKQNLLPVLG